MFFTVYDIRDCLYDAKRTKQLAKAVKKAVKNGDVVVDAGSGSGILALLALKYGAKKVYAIESSLRHRQIIKKNAQLNGFGKKLTVISGDASKVKLPEKVDVILCELIHTGTFFEPQMQVVNNLKKSLKLGGRIMPKILYSYIELVNAREDFYGLKFKYESRPEIGEEILSKRQKFDEIWFTEPEPVKLQTIVRMTATKSGIVNAVRISGKLQLVYNFYLGESKHILMPEIVFLKRPFTVKKGQQYFLEIRYKAGADTTDLHIDRLSANKITPRFLKSCNYLAQKF